MLRREGQYRPQDFDLVISDIVMSGRMDGIALANTMRKPDLPVLLISGYSPAAARVDGSFAVMRKPFELADCQTASKFDPRSASNFDPLWRRALAVALAPSELVGVAETARARVGV